jgi:double-stranded uracil-DNA glycosylase
MPILPDLLQSGLGIVFCGTAVSTRSAQIGAYYAGPGNQFWIVLHAIGLTPRLLMPQEYPMLTEFGIGLTDVVKERFGMDHQLQTSDFDPVAVQRKIEQFAPRSVAFNGKRAASAFYGLKDTVQLAYGRQAELFATSVIFVLPSTSAAAYNFVPAKRDISYQHWRALTDFLQTSDPLK